MLATDAAKPQDSDLTPLRCLQFYPSSRQLDGQWMECPMQDSSRFDEVGEARLLRIPIWGKSSLNVTGRSVFM